GVVDRRDGDAPGGDVGKVVDAGAVVDLEADGATGRRCVGGVSVGGGAQRRLVIGGGGGAHGGEGQDPGAHGVGAGDVGGVGEAQRVALGGGEPRGDAHRAAGEVGGVDVVDGERAGDHLGRVTLGVGQGADLDGGEGRGIV